MTPSFIGRTAMMPSGVRPSMRFASRPTPLIFLVSRSIATTEGSLSTMPSPFTYTSVLAVPRSTAMALAGKNEPDLKKGQRMYVLTRAIIRDASGSGWAKGNVWVYESKLGLFAGASNSRTGEASSAQGDGGAAIERRAPGQKQGDRPLAAPPSLFAKSPLTRHASPQ